jgi:V8-like Glu-specific endopeptidase
MSTLLPISFLEKGLISSRAVVRIEVDDGLGTGFLINGNWIITNNHVLPNREVAKNAVVQFNYQKNLNNLDLPFKEFQLDTGDNLFHTSKEDDWTVVKLNGDANKDYGALLLSTKGVKKDDFVNIIQHPSGGPKQIALYHNTVTSANDRYVLYLTDTMPGSSGSPVFNTDWEVVALHHWGGTIKEAYTNINLYRNRGINIERIEKALSDLKIV